MERRLRGVRRRKGERASVASTALGDEVLRFGRAHEDTLA